ncbi:PucR family transcriptional regulator [Nocardia abscessus]|uniref:PucR family transcriptional regulator n=1 Tax=Nocardia abscessus TaxID=120957 RepID=UPI002457CC97|nr:helix-turn-helix domain-containing protein [Nocardia abscessus]
MGPDAISLRDTRFLAEEMIWRFKQAVAKRLACTGDAVHDDATALTVNYLKIANKILEGCGPPTEHEVAQLESAVARWARERVPIDIILQALHDGSKMAYELVARQSTIATRTERVVIAARTASLLELMTTTVSTAYVREYRSLAGDHRGAVDAFTGALLDGRATTAMARKCGLSIADHYHLLALSMPSPSPSATFDDASDHRVASRRLIGRIRSELVGYGGKEILSVLDICGGTILIPTTALLPDRLVPLIDSVAEVAGAAVTAVHAEVSVDSIPETLHTLHDMVDIADRLADVLSAPPKTRLYAFDELAAEYQLTRPGTVRESLARRLDPLMDHPLLLETLTMYLLNDQNRQRVARKMFVHPNTVDHRLKRIAVITGLDAARADGQWRLRAALVARTFPLAPISSTSEARGREEGTPQQG